MVSMYDFFSEGEVWGFWIYVYVYLYIDNLKRNMKKGVVVVMLLLYFFFYLIFSNI